MADWTRKAIGDLPIHQANTISWLPGFVQGFTTRHGGVSRAPYDSLNLGAHVEDEAADVRINRQRLWGDLGFAEGRVALAEQIHGDEVALVTEGGATPVAGADALITETPNVLLMMLYADCVPVYLVDPVTRSLGLVHAGWRGTAAGLVNKTVRAMQDRFGSQPRSCLAAVGPCIAGDSYEVRVDVVEQFRHMVSQSAATALYPRDEFAGTFNLNLRQIVYSQLLAAGLRAEYVAVSNEDTFRNRRDFFSYRRDGAKTGRMAAFLGMRVV